MADLQGSVPGRGCLWLGGLPRSPENMPGRHAPGNPPQGPCQGAVLFVGPTGRNLGEELEKVRELHRERGQDPRQR